MKYKIIKSYTLQNGNKLILYWFRYLYAASGYYVAEENDRKECVFTSDDYALLKEAEAIYNRLVHFDKYGKFSLAVYNV